MMKNKGFTLAEVLITLAIIGVVAAMTVPTLMTSTRGKEYEVGANKAMSTLANANQMRYAIDGITATDYYAKYGRSYAGAYLLMPPGYDPVKNVDNSRPGEQAALQTVRRNGYSKFELKDGMIILDSNTTFFNDANREYTSYLIDTNGVKGPTRTKTTDSCGSGNFGKETYKMGCTVNSRSVTIDENDVSKNENPDLIVLSIDLVSGAVVPTGQRTRNILATGNAMISR